ncbi:hypothetical protein [Methylobacterium sp. E-045]|uniref:hypothetical protein n=1 Tax=Methylobacterium sp. E-045 TaxID=2836575 RepID=UPI001FBA7FC6|nr:hypothetical protein [Methylobacterium sp. E-045]MCJ2131577.1 hypothetical protein [Methylobacterium sp. E-045]
MPLSLYRIGPDEHHLIQGGEVVGNLAREEGKTSWRVSLVEEAGTIRERLFRSFDAALDWLGLPAVAEPV